MASNRSRRRIGERSGALRRGDRIRGAIVADGGAPRHAGHTDRKVCDLVRHAIDNEIHHRGRACADLRAPDSEPPAFFARV